LAVSHEKYYLPQNKKVTILSFDYQALIAYHLRYTTKRELASQAIVYGDNFKVPCRNAQPGSA
jgi:hypothetical protein